MSSPYAMPTGDIPGYRQIFAEDFSTSCAVGAFQSTYTNFTYYLDGWMDTAGKSGATSRYYPSKVLSAANSECLMYMHTETISGVVRPLGAAILPKIDELTNDREFLYGKIACCIKADSLAGFKAVPLLWPQSQSKLTDGEIDFPEGDLDAAEFKAFMHHRDASGGSDQDQYNTNTPFTDWHVCEVLWSLDRCEFKLDGVSIGVSTVRVPANPMHWVIQNERSLSVNPNPATAGYIHYDWVVMYLEDDAPPPPSGDSTKHWFPITLAAIVEGKP